VVELAAVARHGVAEPVAAEVCGRPESRAHRPAAQVGADPVAARAVDLVVRVVVDPVAARAVDLVVRVVVDPAAEVPVVGVKVAAAARVAVEDSVVAVV